MRRAPERAGASAGSWAARGALAALAAAHLAFVAAWLGAPALLDGAAIVHDDFASHLVGAGLARQAWQATTRLTGWSPDLMAGYHAGGIASLDSKALDVFVALAGGWSVARAATMFYALSIALLPLAAWAAARAAGESRQVAALATAAGAALVWASAARPTAYLGAGMVGWSLVMLLAPWAIVELARWLDAPSPRSFARAAALAALCGLVHVFVVVLVAPAAPAAALARRGRWRALALAAAVGVVALAANAFWVWPDFLRATVDAAAAGKFFRASPERTFHFLVTDLPGRTVVLALGAIGVVALARSGRVRLAAGLGAGAAGALLVGTLGGALPPLRMLEAGRFLDAAAPFLLTPAALTLAGWCARDRRRGLVAAALALVLFAPALATWWRIVRAPGALATWSASGPDANAPQEVRALVPALAATTDRSARLLMEDLDHTDKRKLRGWTHLAGLLPMMLDRETIGGPYRNLPLPEHAVDFGAGVFLGRPLRKWGDAELRAALARYNVGWVVAWSKEAQSSLARRSFLRPLPPVADYALFAVEAPPGFVVDQPAATARASFGRIDVEGAAGSPTLLRYHCGLRMRVEPRLPVSCQPVAGDPVGFVRVDNGTVGAFTVHLK